MDDTYNLLFTGELQPEFEPDSVINALVEDLGLPVEKADKLVNAKRQVIVKRGLDKPKGAKLGKSLEQAGLVVKLVKSAKLKATADLSASKAASRELEADTAPSPSENPYAAPAANLEQQRESEGGQQGEPHKLSAGHGWKWVKDAYGMFKEYPWGWLGAISATYLIITLFSLLPFIGIFLGYILLPIFMGGLMIGAHEQNGGSNFRVGHMFSGFSNNRNQLMLLGILITLGCIVCFIPMLVFFGTAFFTGNFDPEIMSGVNIGMFIVGTLVSMALFIPLYMAMWFSPSLVAIDGHKAWPAVKLSFKGCKKNMLPFLVYSLVFLGGWMVMVAILGIVAAIVIPQIGSIATLDFAALLVIPVLLAFLAVMLPAMAIMGISFYTTYRDIFYS